MQIVSPSEFEPPSPAQLTRLLPGAKLLREREDHGYSVYLLDNRYVYKRFHFPLQQTLCASQREWEIEQAALEALAGLAGIPQSYGTQTEQTNGEQFFHCLRQFIPGQPLNSTSKCQVAAAGRLLGQMHRRLVTSNDPHELNFVAVSDDQLAFIDFGKATVYRRRSHNFYRGVSRDLFKFMYSVTRRDRQLWQAFLSSYHATIGLSLPERAWVRWLYGLRYVRRFYQSLRKGRPLSR